MGNILHVGLDVGSTTVKIIVMDSNKNTIYKFYKMLASILAVSGLVNHSAPPFQACS